MPFGFTRGHQGKHKHKCGTHLKPSEVLEKKIEKKKEGERKQEALKEKLKLNNAGIKKSFKERQKARKAKKAASGEVIGGKLRGCEGIADIAFLEWLVPKGSMDEHTLWARYLEAQMIAHSESNPGPHPHPGPTSGGLQHRSTLRNGAALLRSAAQSEVPAKRGPEATSAVQRGGQERAGKD